MIRSLSLLLILGGCVAAEESRGPAYGETPQPPVAAAPVRTDRDRYGMQPGQYGPEVRIVATFRAPTDQKVFIVNCNGAITTGLQRLDNETWSDAWVAITNQCLSPSIELEPGATRTENIVAVDERLRAGTYRVAFHNVYTSFDANARPWGPELPLEQRVSAPFVIEVPATN